MARHVRPHRRRYTNKIGSFRAGRGAGLYIKPKMKVGNRLLGAVAKYQAKLDTLPADKIVGLEKSLNDTSFSDLFQYQNAQSRAFANNKITFDEAQWLYNVFGRENPSEEKWRKQPLAVKIVATQAVSELLTRK